MPVLLLVMEVILVAELQLWALLVVAVKKLSQSVSERFWVQTLELELA